MEKFAVDLEKVLDEFEINEEREELQTPQNVNRAGHYSQPRLNLPARPPAASYRRPSFEPINLAEADFAASPQSTVVHNYNEEFCNPSLYHQKENVYNSNCVYGKVIPKSNQSESPLYSRTILEQNSAHNETVLKHSSEHSWNININQSNSNQPDDNASFSNPYQNSKLPEFQAPLEYEAPPPYSLLPPPEVVTVNQNTKSQEEKPDLIDTKGHSEDRVPEALLENSVVQLPDIAASGQNRNKSASISTFSSKNVTLDLINSSSVINSALNADSPQTSSNAPIGFNTLHNVSDSELEQYLHELDELEDDTTDDCSLILHDSVTNNLEALKADVEKVENIENVLKQNYVQISEYSSSEPDDSQNENARSSDSQNVNIHYDIQCDSNNDTVLSSTDASIIDSAVSNVGGVKAPDESNSENTDKTISEPVDLRSGDGIKDDVALISKSENSDRLHSFSCDKDLDKTAETSSNGVCSKVAEFDSSSENQINGSMDSDSLTDSQVCDSSKADYVLQTEDSSETEGKQTENVHRDQVKVMEASRGNISDVIESETENESSNYLLSNELSVESVSSEVNCNSEDSSKSTVTYSSEVTDESHCSNFEEHQDTSSNIKSNFDAQENSLHQNTLSNIKSNFDAQESSCVSEVLSHASHVEKLSKSRQTGTIENSDNLNVSKVTDVIICDNSDKSSLNEATSSENSHDNECVGAEVNIVDHNDQSISDSVQADDDDSSIFSGEVNLVNQTDQFSTSEASNYVSNAVSPANNEVSQPSEPSSEPKPIRPNSLHLASQITVSSETHDASSASTPNRETPSNSSGEFAGLGKSSPYWIPDNEALNCMCCDMKFTLIRRRHHCRACGLLLCSKCCNMRTKLEYMEFAEARVCLKCYLLLDKGAQTESEQNTLSTRSPNPNNPMEYCSTIPPLQQAASALHQPVPSVLVPVGVLKREGRNKSETPKQVIFSDGIRPGGDLTELDGSTEPRLPIKRQTRQVKMKGDQRTDDSGSSYGRSEEGGADVSHRRGQKHKLMKLGCARHNSSFIDINSLPENSLPCVVTRHQGETRYSELEKPITLDDPPIKFAIKPNLFLIVKRLYLDCCINLEVWCLTTEGLACVCQDEIVFVLQCLPDEQKPPRDIFLFVDSLYKQAPKGVTYSELSFAPVEINNFLGSKDHGGFLFIRTSYQCVNKLILPPAPYLVGLLIHRWEAPWAKLFPIRLMLRYGAEYRYYPCFLVSIRFRQSLYFDIGTTIIRFLADFRKFEYTLSSVRGLKIHMEDRQTTILLPRNRYDQVVKAINNSNDSVLAFSGNFSYEADSHFVCMQNNENESYFTQAIYINSRPRKITGASFVVFNGALKPCGLSGKSVLVEDGFMVYIPSESMVALRNALKDMKDYSIGCGENSEVVVLLKWSEDDTHFNMGVQSVIDGKPLDGIPSIRVHNGADFFGNSRFIRWTEVFIFHSEEDTAQGGDSIDVSRLSESLAHATCKALVPLLDLLASVSLYTLAVRVTIHPEKVGYEAGSAHEKLPPLYMKRLDDGLIPLLHQAAIKNQDSPTTLELVFRIMEQA